MMQLSFVLALHLGGAPPEPTACAPPLDRTRVAECALRTSPALRADLERVAATHGEALEARTLLPSNPELALSAAGRRNDASGADFNLYGTLTQTIEIGGQRRKRVAVVEAHREVHEVQATLTEREVVAAALLAYYDVLAAEQEQALVGSAAQIVARLRELANERAAAGVGTRLDAELAAALHARQREQLALAEGRVKEAQARLSALVGLDPTLDSPAVQGELVPLPLSEQRLAELGRLALRDRPEIARARASREVQSRQLDLLRRERVPSPSLSVFVQRDGFEERVIGGGLSFPIPLPAPLGRINRGRIEATQARMREAEARIAAQERRVRTETAIAFHEYRAREMALAAYPEDAATSAQAWLAEVAAELEAGRLSIRDALIAQEALLDALLRRTEARHALCSASVRLALATGLPLDEGAR